VRVRRALEQQLPDVDVVTVGQRPLLAVVVLPDGLADLLARATVRPESQA